MSTCCRYRRAAVPLLSVSFLTLSLWSPRLPAIVIVYMLQVPPRCCTTNGYCPHSALSTSLRPCRQWTLRLLSCTRCRRRHAAASSLNSCCPHSATLSVLSPCDQSTCLLSMLTYCRRRHAAVPKFGDRGGSCQAGGHRQHDGTVRKGHDLRWPRFTSPSSSPSAACKACIALLGQLPAAALVSTCGGHI